jgi:hypothetical protein
MSTWCIEYHETLGRASRQAGSHAIGRGVVEGGCSGGLSNLGPLG